MEKNFTSLRFETPIVNFNVYKNPDSEVYRAVVSAPIDFEVHFKMNNGNFVQVSNNPDFYDSLIGGVKTAVTTKEYQLNECFAVPAHRGETIRFAETPPNVYATMPTLLRSFMQKLGLSPGVR